MVQVTQMTPAPGVLIVAALSLAYLCSSDIFALINYVGFATWVTTNYQVCSAPSAGDLAAVSRSPSGWPCSASPGCAGNTRSGSGPSR